MSNGIDGKDKLEGALIVPRNNDRLNKVLDSLIEAQVSNAALKMVARNVGEDNELPGVMNHLLGTDLPNPKTKQEEKAPQKDEPKVDMRIGVYERKENGMLDFTKQTGTRTRVAFVNQANAMSAYTLNHMRYGNAMPTELNETDRYKKIRTDLRDKLQKDVGGNADDKALLEKAELSLKKWTSDNEKAKDGVTLKYFERLKADLEKNPAFSKQLEEYKAYQAAPDKTAFPDIEKNPFRQSDVQIEQLKKEMEDQVDKKPKFNKGDKIADEEKDKKVSSTVDPMAAFLAQADKVTLDRNLKDGLPKLADNPLAKKGFGNAV